MRVVALLVLASCRLNFDEVRGTSDGGLASDGDVGSASCSVRLFAGRQHFAALWNDGTLRMWGDNDDGQVGQGHTDDVLEPTVVTLPAPVVSAGAGRYNSCAALATGEVRCWGGGTSGQLGDGMGTSSLAPVIVSGLADAVEVAPAAVHSCARLAIGEVYCWGEGGSGRLGRGSTQSSLVPVRTSGIASARSLVSGGSTSCVSLEDTSPRCWGYNGDGTAGVGTTTDVLSPMQPVGLASVRSISPRDQTTCVVRGDGAVLCFGANGYGQAGSDTGGADLLTATPVEQQDSAPLVGADEVGQGIAFGCARIGTSVWCWGADDVGQLGDGTGNSSRPYAAPVVGLPPVRQLAVGAFNACAVDMAMNVWCWGDGSQGELGDGMRNAPRFMPQVSFAACP